jgi:hypothetical protein
MLESQYCSYFLREAFKAGAGAHEIKVAQRIAYLQEHPEKRIRIDGQALKSIIPYDRFLCHPNSSIAFDRAVEGSDIDEAIVITEQPVADSEKRMFTEALKSQGFRVLHPEEVQNKPQEAFVVQFWTHKQILDFKKEKGGAHNHMTLAVYYGGHQIDGEGAPRDDQESIYQNYGMRLDHSFSPPEIASTSDNPLKDIDMTKMAELLKKFGKSM